jgi:zinc transporter, ZIP family
LPKGVIGFFPDGSKALVFSPALWFFWKGFQAWKRVDIPFVRAGMRASGLNTGWFSQLSEAAFMTDFFSSPVGMALLAGCCTWAFTAFGAGMVYTAKSFSRRTLDVMLGFAAGVMIAASYWSLLAPALEMSSHLGRLACVPVALGFLAGAGVLRLVDLILPHIHPTENVPDGPPSKLPRSALLVFAITLHNIPEGLAVGVAFGAAASGAPEASIAGAMTLMFGMGLQNIPEGVAVSVPLLREGFSKNRAFFFGQLSGIVEPIAAVFGALVVGIAEPILPFALAFAAGAMIFVVVEEVIPESHASGHGDAASLGVIIGFVVMMCLDVALA